MVGSVISGWRRDKVMNKNLEGFEVERNGGRSAKTR